MPKTRQRDKTNQTPSVRFRRSGGCMAVPACGALHARAGAGTRASGENLKAGRPLLSCWPRMAWLYRKLHQYNFTNTSPSAPGPMTTKVTKPALRVGTTRAVPWEVWVRTHQYNFTDRCQNLYVRGVQSNQTADALAGACIHNAW